MSLNYTPQLQDIEWRRRPAEPLNKEVVLNKMKRKQISQHVNWKSHDISGRNYNLIYRVGIILLDYSAIWWNSAVRFLINLACWSKIWAYTFYFFSHLDSAVRTSSSQNKINQKTGGFAELQSKIKLHSHFLSYPNLPLFFPSGSNTLSAQYRAWFRVGGSVFILTQKMSDS